MTNIFSPKELDEDNKLFCCYTNCREKVVIVHISDIPGRYRKRVVFLGERFLFEALKDSQIEVDRYTSVGFIKDTIPC